MRKFTHIRVSKVFIALFILSSTVFFSGAYSAILNSGKNKKRSTTRNGFSHFSLKNGYQFRGFQHMNSHTPLMMTGAYRYQKGNVIYVIPAKKQNFFSKFQTPQKAM